VFVLRIASERAAAAAAIATAAVPTAITIATAAQRAAHVRRYRRDHRRWLCHDHSPIRLSLRRLVDWTQLPRLV
tara:strand:- start:7 stop:228 length:222 start_codon:yes stop_codon:yes gene_type:complete